MLKKYLLNQLTLLFIYSGGLKGFIFTQLHQLIKVCGNMTGVELHTKARPLGSFCHILLII